MIILLMLISLASMEDLRPISLLNYHLIYDYGFSRCSEVRLRFGVSVALALALQHLRFREKIISLSRSSCHGKRAFPKAFLNIMEISYGAEYKQSSKALAEIRL